jgi:hypothetical protein
MSLFNYNLSVTGDCSNVGVGAILVVPTGGTPPYTVEWTTPSLGEDQAVLESFRGGLYPNTYVIRVNDSTLPTNQEFFINIPVSDGICASIVQVNDTTCSLLNGSVTATSTSDYSSTNYYLFDSGNSFITSAITTTSTAVFENLSAGTYSIMALDLGGCTGVTPTFIIDDSGPFDFGLYVVPNSSCGGTPIGKILVTGLTGQAPYSYLWTNRFHDYGINRWSVFCCDYRRIWMSTNKKWCFNKYFFFGFWCFQCEYTILSSGKWTNNPDNYRGNRTLLLFSFNW